VHETEARSPPPQAALMAAEHARVAHNCPGPPGAPTRPHSSFTVGAHGNAGLVG
jgi:hypothetical protein